MKQMRSRLLALGTALALSAGLTTAAMAADNVTISTPKSGATYYVGEKIPIKMTTVDLSDGYMKENGLYLWDSEATDEEEAIENFTYSWKNEWIGPNKGDVRSCKLNTAKLSPGKYNLTGTMSAWYDSDSEDGPPYLVTGKQVVKLTLKKLKAPTKLKAAAGKRKVTVSWKKAEGAKQYEIYRSSKKNSGYKRIATTAKTKYENKKLKKGKRYYYKVRTLGGSVKSGFTKPVRSGKVK